MRRAIYLLPLFALHSAVAMERSDFTPLVRDRGVPHPAFQVHSLYAAKDLSGAVFIRREIQATPQLKSLVSRAWIETKTSHGKGLVHYRLGSNGTVSVFYFHKIDSGSAKALVRELGGPSSAGLMPKWNFTFFNEAHAEVLDCKTDLGINGAEALENLSSGIELHAIQSMALSCMGDVLDGAVGSVKDSAKQLRDLFTDPMKVAKQFGAMWDGIKLFVTDFSNQISGIYTALRDLPADQLGQIVCGAVGGIGVGVLVSILTGGGGLGKVALSLTQYTLRIQKLSGLLRFLTQIQGWAKKMPKNLFARMMKGDIPDQYIDDVSTLHRFDPELGVEALQCGI